MYIRAKVDWPIPNTRKLQNIEKIYCFVINSKIVNYRGPNLWLFDGGDDYDDNLIQLIYFDVLLQQPNGQSQHKQEEYNQNNNK